MVDKILMSAGDASGDIHAAGLCQALQALYPSVYITGIGDTAMAAAGIPLLADQTGMRQVGIGSIVRSAPHHWQLGKRLLRYIAGQQPDVVILTDYGGFHLRLAKAIRNQLPQWQGKLVYFIPPQVWASRPYRIQTLKQTVDLVLGILPFEAELYQRHHIPYQFVGHPITAALPNAPTDRAAACAQLGVSDQWPIVAIFPGSRRMELNYLLPVLAEALPLMQAVSADPLQFVLAEAPGVSLEPVLQQWAQQFGARLQVTLTRHAHLLQAVADAAIVKSGTSTLETAWYGTPQVIIYKGHPLTYLVSKYLITVPCLGLPNLLLLNDWSKINDLPIPECLQNQLKPETLANLVLQLLNPDARQAQQRASAQLHQLLTQSADPYTVAAQAIQALCVDNNYPSN